MLTITADNSAFKSYLDKLQKTLGDLTPAMRGIGMAMENRVKGRFETKTDPVCPGIRGQKTRTNTTPERAPLAPQKWAALEMAC